MSSLAAQRNNGSWLLDGLLPIDKMKQILPIPELREEESGNDYAVCGFVIVQLGGIPKLAESFDWRGYRFEAMDMEKNLVDDVLAIRLTKKKS